MVEIRRVDIITEVLLMASQMAMPREGHLDAILHIFGFLRRKYNSRMAFDPTVPFVDESVFKVATGRNFMVMCWRQSLLMHRNLVEQASAYGCTLTVTTLERRRREGPGRVSLFSLTGR